MHGHLKMQVTISLSDNLLSFGSWKQCSFLVSLLQECFLLLRDHALYEITRRYVLVVTGADLSWTLDTQQLKIVR